MKTVSIGIQFTFETESDVSDEEIAECVANGFIVLRDNSFAVASVENFETGEVKDITILDFTMNDL